MYKYNVGFYADKDVFWHLFYIFKKRKWNNTRNFVGIGFELMTSYRAQFLREKITIFTYVS